MHLIVMHLILLLLPGYELSSDEDEPPLHSEDPADDRSALDDMQSQIGPPIPQKPPAPPPFDFAAFTRPVGISDGAYQLRMDNIWFCKLLLLFKIHTKTDTGMHWQYLDCAYV